ncbi:hypothetical protein L207DRAFT_512124 [Hyaloscypha variabilis F]|uniref:Uncharacterized protein n=1 Tax=Hyaloscypha variabilis (strain UAMH 11265 / GT02V1 / F) TaxID=1149755 RepID=A0A2J6RQ75_HYAVF|nr:hypothetical protein L207DRAFT_512124 [Hyaloscypha variabilis F]
MGWLKARFLICSSTWMSHNLISFMVPILLRTELDQYSVQCTEVDWKIGKIYHNLLVEPRTGGLSDAHSRSGIN